MMLSQGQQMYALFELAMAQILDICWLFIIY